MITLRDYFGTKIDHPDATAGRKTSAEMLLERVNGLLDSIPTFNRRRDPDTGTEVSGSRGGAGDGGFRLSTATTGKEKSMHKQAHAVDVYDPDDLLDDLLDDAILTEHGLYREAPGHTPGWCHLQDSPPASGRRTFIP